MSPSLLSDTTDAPGLPCLHLAIGLESVISPNGPDSFY